MVYLYVLISYYYYYYLHINVSKRADLAEYHSISEYLHNEWTIYSEPCGLYLSNYVSSVTRNPV